MENTPQGAKPLCGFGGAGVLELIEDYYGDTYRAVYTVRFRKTLYVLHVFQKKSKHGVATPHHELAVIRQRYKIAQEHYGRTYTTKRDTQAQDVGSDPTSET